VLLSELKGTCRDLQTPFTRLVKKYDHAFAGYFRLIEIAPVERDPDIEP
jgi:hypothetical protein